MPYKKQFDTENGSGEIKHLNYGDITFSPFLVSQKRRCWQSGQVQINTVSSSYSSWRVVKRRGVGKSRSTKLIHAL